MTIHALGKAVPQARKLANGVRQRRGEDVELEISAESVTVFDDVFPSGENLEVRCAPRHSTFFGGFLVLFLMYLRFEKCMQSTRTLLIQHG